MEDLNQLLQTLAALITATAALLTAISLKKKRKR